MTVLELMEQLRAMDENAEVRIAQQPNWPFEYSIDEVLEVSEPDFITHDEFGELDEDHQAELLEKEDEGRLVIGYEHERPQGPVVYLAEGRQIGYLPAPAARELGWK